MIHKIPKYTKWESGGVTLYCTDCNDIIPNLSREYVVVTDPPYGIDHPSKYFSQGRSVLARAHDYTRMIGDNKPFSPELCLSFSSAVLWGANYFSDKLPPSGGWLVWDKERPDDLDQSTCELAWTNCVKGVRIFHHLWHGMIRASERGLSYHPTQKPVALMKWILHLPGLVKVKKILDPYMGSGPIGVACVLLEREYIGVEQVPEYFNLAKRRIIAAQQFMTRPDSKEILSFEQHTTTWASMMRRLSRR